jgi:hypothetical protein
MTIEAYIFTSSQLWIVVSAAFAFGLSCGSLVEFRIHRFRCGPEWKDPAEEDTE